MHRTHYTDSAEVHILHKPFYHLNSHSQWCICVLCANKMDVMDKYGHTTNICKHLNCKLVLKFSDALIQINANILSLYPHSLACSLEHIQSETMDFIGRIGIGIEMYTQYSKYGVGVGST